MITLYSIETNLYIILALALYNKRIGKGEWIKDERTDT